MGGLRRTQIAERPARTFALSVVEELTDLELQVGGRRGLLGLLLLAPQTKDLSYMVGLLGDPKNAGKSLAAILALGNLTPGHLMEQLRKAALLKGQTLASLHIAKGLPAVVEDVLRKAAPYDEACGVCLGTGAITPDPSPENPNPTHHPCPTCRGGGKLRYQPDLDTQKLALEVGQMLQKGGGINVLTQINAAAGASGGTLGGGSLERMQAMTDRLLYEGLDPADPEPPAVEAPAAVEGEVVDGPAA